MLPDPNDEMVLETALNGCADAIVTFNDWDAKGCRDTGLYIHPGGRRFGKPLHRVPQPLLEACLCRWLDIDHSTSRINMPLVA
jgi:hypothetical protein